METKFRYPVGFWITSTEMDPLLHAFLMTLRAFSSFLSGSQIPRLLVSSTNKAKLTALPSSFFPVCILNPTCAQGVVKISLDCLRLAMAPGSKTNKESSR